MYNYQKIAKAVMKNFPGGKTITYSEIIEKVLSEFPKMKRGSIIPSDLCENHTNEDPKSGKHTIFNKDKINKGRYTVLPHNKIKKSCKLNN